MRRQAHSAARIAGLASLAVLALLAHRVPLTHAGIDIFGPNGTDSMLSQALGDWNERDMRTYFGSKCPYSFAPPLPGSAPLEEALDFAVSQRLQPVAAYFVVRHGTRTPGRGTISRLNKLQGAMGRILRRAVSAGDLDLDGLPSDSVLRWRNPFENAEVQQLVPAGEAELRGIGTRLASALPTLFGRSAVLEGGVNITASDTSRTRESAAAFANGAVFGPMAADEHGVGDGVLRAATGDDIKVVPVTDDRELRAYDLCDAYQEYKHDLHSDEDSDGTAFQNYIHVRLGPSVAKKMSSQHGFDVLGHTSWRRRLSRYGWEACKAETAVSETATASPWCSMFDDDPKAMSWLETLEDMEVYWAKGPGADINAALAGPLAGSIVQFMTYHARAAAAEDGSGVAEGDGGANGANGEDDEDNDQGPAWSPAVVRVAHAETVVPLVQALGIAVGDDPNLHTADVAPSAAFSDEWPPRQWRTSTVMPFAANVLLVLMRSADGDLKVGIAVNEHVVPMPCGPGGADALWCDVHKVARLLNRVAELDFDCMCAPRSGRDAATGHVPTACGGRGRRRGRRALDSAVRKTRDGEL